MASMSQSEPLIALRICSRSAIFHPGALLRAEYQIDAIQPAEIQAVEASILWYTEGKGDEDLGVQYFERTTPSDSVDGDLRQLHAFQTVLPRSPLTYNGFLVKIRWCVRVRLFWGGGRQLYVDRGFQLVPRDQGSEPARGESPLLGMSDGSLSDGSLGDGSLGDGSLLDGPSPSPSLPS